MMKARSRFVRWSLATGLALIATPLAAQPTIVLIGGKKQGMATGEHDFPDGVLKLERLIKSSPDFAKLKPVVKTYPVGFPKNLAEIDDASVVLLYFGPVAGADGKSVNPAQDPAVQAQLAKLAARGVGFVAMHQAFTVPDKANAAPLADLLGGIRASGSDYAMEAAPVSVVAKGHPVTSGVGNFDYLDEYYSAIDFGKVTPVLSGRAHVQFRQAGAVYEEPAKNRTIAWTVERPGGGRTFSFAGGHYLASLDHPQVRTVLLNAILWAAKLDVPQAGATSTIPTAPRMGAAPPPAPQILILPYSDVKPEAQPWGKLEWFASRPLGNSSKLTVGQATISPGKQNPVHWHPNCDEVLHVLRGHIMHRVGDKEYEMKAGDTVVIPEGVLHNARNIGTEDAVLAVSFNSADRVAIGE